MALAVDKVSSFDQNLGGYSWTFTPTTTTPAGILVWVATYNTGGADLITGVTYGGVALTKIGSTLHVVAADTVDGLGQAWYLPLNTLSGAQTVAVQKSGVPSSNSVSVMVVSYTTAGATTPIALDTNNSATGTGFSSTASLTTTADAHITALSIEPDLSSPLRTSPTAPVADVLEDDWGLRMSNYGQIAAIQAAGTYSVGFTFDTSTAWGVMGVAIKEGATPIDEPLGFNFIRRRRRVDITELPHQLTVSMVGGIGKNMRKK